MDIVVLLLFVSSILASMGVGLFVWSVKEGTYDHTDRLGLLALDEEAPSAGDKERGTKNRI